MNSLTKESLIVSLMSQRFKGGFSVLWDGSSADKQNFKSSCFKCCGHCHWLFSEFLGNRESLWLNSVDLPKEMQSLVGKLLFDELFHSATQLVIVPHNIKNSRLILRCLWFFTEPTKTKTQKSFCTDWNLFLMNIQRTGFNHTEQKKHINPTTFIDTTSDSGVSSRCLSAFQHKSVNNFLFLGCSPSVLCCFSTYFGDRST